MSLLSGPLLDLTLIDRTASGRRDRCRSDGLQSHLPPCSDEWYKMIKPCCDYFEAADVSQGLARRATSRPWLCGTISLVKTTASQPFGWQFPSA